MGGERRGAAEAERLFSAFRGACRKAGVRMTRQRVEIFRAAASSLEHPTADAVFRIVQSRLPSISLDTVYRTLWRLSDLGAVSALGPRRGSARFDAETRRHHHYVCVRCGRIRDFEGPPLRRIEIPASVRRMGRVLETRLEVRGLCAGCARGQGR